MYARKYNYNKREVLAKANELRPPELTDLSASWSMYCVNLHFAWMEQI